MTSTITILGAGPAGMTAALFAARAGLKVQLIDRNERVGRKLLVTGAGRANLTNQQMGAGHYPSVDPAWMERVLVEFGHADLIKFFRSIGILTFATHDGWCYPLSESAQSVVDAFENALHLAGVKLLLGQHITAIRKDGARFLLAGKDGVELPTERLVVASGGKASPNLGSSGDLFASLRALGHAVVPVRPALAPLTAEMKPWQKLKGLRLDACASLYEDGNLLAETTGNLIFTEWGMNGPAVMDLSHHVSARPAAALQLRLNPLFDREERLRALLADFRATPTPLTTALSSVLPPKLSEAILPMCKLAPGATLNHLNDAQLEKVLRLLRAMPFTITGTRGFEFCQVSSGGVPTAEVHPRTMRSNVVAGLSLAGEAIDVIGPCGGYNLQFAFSSGAIAGQHLK
jgi:predicted Rossmann fold flavoprotein